MGCVDYLDDLHDYKSKLYDIRWDMKKEVSKRIKQFVDECLYEDFLEMIQTAYLNEDQVFEDVWMTKLKLTELHRVAQFNDFNSFDEAYTHDRSLV